MVRKKSDTVAIQVRMKESLRAKIEKAAEENGVSMNAEMVDRLGQSFSEEDVVGRMFGNEGGLQLARAIATVTGMAEIATGQSAFEDRQTAQVAREAIDGILDYLLPSKAHQEIDETEPAEGQEAILGNPEARSLGKNIRDAFLEPILRSREKR